MILKPIPEFEHLYAASECGHIFSIKNGRRRKLNPWKNDAGYLRLMLRKDGKMYGRMVHRLILITFDRPPLEGEEGDHDDGDKENNAISNLAWKSHADNMKHAATLPVYQKRKKAVIGTHLATGEVIQYESVNAAVRDGFGAAISEACRGKRKGHKGYSWRWANEQV